MPVHYDPRETRHCDACGELGHAGGMLLQPGRVWVHRRCAKPHTKWGKEEARILAAIRAFRASRAWPWHLEHRSDRRLEKTPA